MTASEKDGGRRDVVEMTRVEEGGGFAEVEDFAGGA